MSVADRLRLAYWILFSQPARDRPLLRLIKCRGVLRILEVGMGTGERARRMIDIARLASPHKGVFYAGIDLFEERSAADGPGMPLKEAYCRLRGNGVRVQLIPGDPLASLAQTANSLGRFDLVVISRWPTRDTLGGAWLFLPRILRPTALVFREQDAPSGALEQLTPAEIGRLAMPPRARRAA